MNINFRDPIMTKNFANIYFREFIHNWRNSRKLMIAKINDLKVFLLSKIDVTSRGVEGGPFDCKRHDDVWCHEPLTAAYHFYYKYSCEPLS